MQNSSVSPLIFAAIVPLAVPGDVQTRVALAGTLALLAGKLCGFSTGATSFGAEVVAWSENLDDTKAPA